MKRQRALKGANLIDYVVPTIVIGVVAGAAFFGFAQNNSIRSNILGALSGQFELTKGEITFGTGTQKPGMYQNTNGDYYLITKTGKNISVPANLADAVKESILKHQDEMGTNTVGEETTGAFGLQETQNTDSDFMTAQYSEILDTIAKECENNTAKKLLTTLSAFANNLALTEGKLVEINKVMEEKKEAYELSEAAFHEKREAFINMLQSQEYKSQDELINTYYEYRDAYDAYMQCTKDYKEASKNYVEKANKAFNKLEKDTGIAYELLLFLVKANKKVPEDAKEIAVPIGEEIVQIKNDVVVTKEKVAFLKTVLDEQEHEIKSEVNEYFDALKIIVDDDEALKAFTNNQTASFQNTTNTNITTQTESQDTETLLTELDQIIEKINTNIINNTNNETVSLNDTTIELNTDETTETPDITVDDLDNNTISTNQGQNLVKILTDLDIEDENSVDNATEQILDIVTTNTSNNDG